MAINCSLDYPQNDDEKDDDTHKSTAMILSCEVMSSCSSDLKGGRKKVKIPLFNCTVPLIWANLFFASVVLVAEVGHRVFLPLWIDSPNGTVAGAKMNPYFALSFSSITFAILFGLGTIFIRIFSPKDIGETEKHFSHLPFFFVGICDALNGVLIVFACKGSRTPPYLQAILGNFLIPLTVLFRLLILRRKPTYLKLLCAIVVVVGLLISLIPTVFRGFDEEKKIEPTSESRTHISRIMWPIIFMLGSIPEALMRVVEERGVKTENETSGKQINLVYFLFWTSLYELLFVLAFFWIDLIPWYGEADGLKNFGERWWLAFQCFFGEVGCNEAPGVRGTVYIVTHVLCHAAAACLLRHAEGATFLAIVTSLVTPLGFIFWTLFREQPFQWHPEGHVSTWFSIGALALMVPAIFVYNMGAPEISLSPGGSREEEIHCSTRSDAKYQRSGTECGPEKPLLSGSKRHPRYSVFEA